MKSLKLGSNLKVLLFLGLFFFLFSYKMSPATPEMSSAYPSGFYEWWDQSRYLLMAKQISNLHLVNYDYGLGYPIAGALFYRFLPADPFLIPNIFLWLASIYLMYKICLALLSSTHAFFAVFLFIFATGIVDYTIIPWNSTPVLFSNLLICYLGLKEGISYRRTFLIPLLLIWIFASRYIDIVFSFFLAILYLYKVLKDKKRLNHLVLFFATLSAGIFLILLSHKIYFNGYFNTPYITHKGIADGYSDQDLQRYNIFKIPENFLGVMVGLRQERVGIYTGLLISSFWIVLSAFGFLIELLQTKNKKTRQFLLLSSIAIFLSFSFYSSFPGFRALTVKNGCLHYIKTWIPFLTIYSMFVIARLNKNANA